MAKRTSTKLPDIQMTIQEAEEQLAIYAAADAKLEKTTAQMDLEVTKIREKYADKINQAKEEKEASYEKLLVYGSQNREKFLDKRSIELSHGKIGFRTGTPALKTAKGFTWIAVLELAKKLCPDYVRTKEELAKDALLVDRETDKGKEAMEAIGVVVVQEESWFVELKKEQAHAEAIQ